MDIPETLAKQDTQDTVRRQTHSKKENTPPPKKNNKKPNTDN